MRGCLITAEERDRALCHAAFYALWLRHNGVDEERAAELVLARYPETRVQLGYRVRQSQLKAGIDNVSSSEG